MRKYTYERLDGSVRAEERFAAIRSFSLKPPEGPVKPAPGSNDAFVFMISTRAGGVGLNLVAADTVSFWRTQCRIIHINCNFYFFSFFESFYIHCI